jgi:hypothetical protein
MSSQRTDICPEDLNIYLINLPERKDRLMAANKELTRLGWSLHGRPVTLYAATRFAERGPFPSASIRGAFHSHFECLRTGLMQQSGHVLLLEDDIAFAGCVPKLLPSVFTELAGRSWDFCYLGHEDTGSIARADSRTQGISFAQYDGPIIGLHFCIVNRRVLPRLIRHLEHIASGIPGDDDYGPMPVDGAFNTFRRLNPHLRTLIANPKLGWQRPSRSDITPGYLDQFEYLRPVISVFRRMKYAVSGFHR